MFENITGSKSNAVNISISPGVRRWSDSGRGSSCACSNGDPATMEPSPANAVRRDMLLAHLDSMLIQPHGDIFALNKITFNAGTQSRRAFSHEEKYFASLRLRVEFESIVCRRCFRRQRTMYFH